MVVERAPQKVGQLLLVDLDVPVTMKALLPGRPAVVVLLLLLLLLLLQLGLHDSNLQLAITEAKEGKEGEQQEIRVDPGGKHHLAMLQHLLWWRGWSLEDSPSGSSTLSSTAQHTYLYYVRVCSVYQAKP